MELRDDERGRETKYELMEDSSFGTGKGCKEIALFKSSMKGAILEEFVKSGRDASSN